MKNKRFEEYFQRYQDLIMKIVMDKTGSYHDAEEICQQVFISFYLNMESVSDDLVKAWLIRCTKNAIIDHYRKASRQREVVTDTSEAAIGNIAMDKETELSEIRLDNLDLMGRVLRAVKAVNQQWFEVLFMSCVEGLSYAEMAGRLKVPETVLRARLYRARLYIKEKFGNEFRDK